MTEKCKYGNDGEDRFTYLLNKAQKAEDNEVKAYRVLIGAKQELDAAQEKHSNAQKAFTKASSLNAIAYKEKYDYLETIEPIKRVVSDTL
jgi:flagellar hook-length control protein FliK